MKWNKMNEMKNLLYINIQAIKLAKPSGKTKEYRWVDNLILQ